MSTCDANANCIEEVMSHLREDTEFIAHMRRFFERKLLVTIPKHVDLIGAFMDSMGADEGKVIPTLKSRLAMGEEGITDGNVKEAIDHFCTGLMSRCEDRENFKRWFDVPNPIERGLGILFFSILFLYGWIDESTSTAFTQAMQASQASRKHTEEMSMLRLLMANYLELGAVQILWSMVVTLAKSWVLMVAILMGLYFVEVFIVEAAVSASFVEGLVLSRNRASLKSLRIATVFLLDSKVLFAILLAILVSLVFACGGAFYLAMSKHLTPEDAKFVGKMVCAFQLCIVFSFVAFSLFGRSFS